MKIRALVLSAAACIGWSSMSAGAQTARWGSPDEPTVKEMVAKETMWADSSCGPQPELAGVIAADFQGTATDGRRYGKAEAIETDARALDRDCRFGDVRVRFFGEDLAVAYGDESSVHKGKDGKESKRCLVWTDPWLKRDGRWQIIAAQDTVVACK